MGNRLVVAALAILVAVNIVLFYAVFRRDATAPTPGVTAPEATRTTGPSAAATGTPTGPPPRAPRSGTPAATTTATHRAAPSTPSTPTTPASASATATVTPSAARGGIEIAPTSYVAEPFQTVRITGRYPGVPARTTLRIEHLEGGSWRRFPLPTTTADSGRFDAYVELGGHGPHLVRVVDPERGATSPAVTVTIG